MFGDFFVLCFQTSLDVVVLRQRTSKTPTLLLMALPFSHAFLSLSKHEVDGDGV